MMEYAQRPRSALLAQILQRMQQQQQFQPQSYGALAAGLGEAYLNNSMLKGEEQRIAQKEAADKSALVQALRDYQTNSQGGTQNIPLELLEGGTQNLQQNVMADPERARNRLMESLAGNENPMAQAGAGALFQQMLAGEEAYTLSQGDVRLKGKQKIAENPKPAGEGEETWKPATPEQREAYGVPEGYGAQISSSGKMATLGKDGQIININNIPAVPPAIQENLVGAVGMKRALNDMLENYDFAALPGEGAVRGKLASYTGMDPKALAYQTAYDNFRTQQQAIIKGIPSNFDVKLFERAAPSPGLAPEAKKARIEFQSKLTDDLVKMTIAFYKGSKSPVPQAIVDQAKGLGIDIGSVAPNANVSGYDEILEMDGKKLVRLSDGTWMPIPEGVQ